MPNNGTLVRGTSSFTAAAAKYGTAGLASGVYDLGSAVDSFYVSSANNGLNTVGTFRCYLKVPAGTAKTLVAMGHYGLWLIGMDTSGNVLVAASDFGTNRSYLTSGAKINDGAWHFVELVMRGNGTDPLFFIDGTLTSATRADNASGGPSSYTTLIGGFGDSSSATGNGAQYDWASAGGVIDEVEISNVARHTSSYTPPTAALTPDANTTGLYHLDGTANDSSSASGALTVVAPNNAGILYSPYAWDVTSSRALTANGGYFSTLVSGINGANFTLNFDVSNVPQGAGTQTRVLYRVDRGSWTDTSITSSTPSITVTPPAVTNLWPSHLLEFVVKATTGKENRWASPYITAVKFTGIGLPSGGSLVAPTAKTLNILCLGDSITEGCCVYGPSTSSNDITTISDTSLSAPYFLAEMLGANVGVIGWAGQGVSVAGGANVPAAPATVTSIVNGIARSFTPVPDVVYINQTTNDGYQNVAATTVQSALTNMINAVQAATPTSIIIVQRPWYGYYTPALYQNAIAAATNPSKCIYVEAAGVLSSTDTAEGTHPYGYINGTKLAPFMATAIRAALARSGSFVNVNGTAKRISGVRR